MIRRWKQNVFLKIKMKNEMVLKTTYEEIIIFLLVQNEKLF